MNVKVSDLMEKAKKYEKYLNEEGFLVKVTPYFAYGSYAFFFDFRNKENTKHKQIYTGLGTKKECFENLEKCFRETMNRKEYYKLEGDER